MYVVNMNRELMRGEFYPLLHESAPALSNLTSWSVTPSNFTVATGEIQEIAVTVNSAGLRPGRYTLVLGLTAWTRNSLPITTSFSVDFQIQSVADANFSIVTVSGNPTLGSPWEGITIEPRDSDDFPLAADTSSGPNVEFSLDVKKGEFITIPTVRWSSEKLYYVVECMIPRATQLAGDWNLTLSLQSIPFFWTHVSAQCAKDDFKNNEERCEPCPDPGTACKNAGITFSSLPMDSGYWRSGKRPTGAC